MNKLIIIFLAVFVSCKSPSQKNDGESSAISIKESFSENEERKFLDQFPKDFESFKNTFGWDDKRNAPEPLYNDSEKYIDYFFSLLEKPEFKKYENVIISISENAKWEADAVNSFQDHTLSYIKKNNRFDLINSLNGEKSKAVLSFLFAEPVFNNDVDFIKRLDREKQAIVQKLSKENISSEKKRSVIATYENNDDYFIKSFDVNKDGIADKIVSSKPYKGNDLFVFYGNRNEQQYKLVMETANFSEDGGNIIKDIVEISGQKGLKILTSFPDRGYYEKEIILIPQNNSWFLKKIIYKTMSDMSENAVKYICDVTQNIDITKSGWSNKINQMPAENERDKKCRMEKNIENTDRYFIDDPDGYTNLRKESNTSSEIIQKVKSGEAVTVINALSSWFYVETKSGKKGYIHRSRLKPHQ